MSLKDEINEILNAKPPRKELVELSGTSASNINMLYFHNKEKPNKTLAGYINAWRIKKIKELTC